MTPRSVDEIQAAIITDVQAQPELAAASSTSKRAIWRLWTFVVASSIAILEQLMQVFQTDIEKTVSLAAPQTSQWVQDRVFKFQYDAANPQVLQLIDLVPQYEIVNADLRIVTRCSVKTNLSNSVFIKVAKINPPEALSVLEVSALQSYVDILAVPGISYTVVSANPDRLYIQADIYYNGAYSAIIKANVIAAIEAYFAALPFDGTIKVSDVETAILSVEGVRDVVLINVAARADTTLFADATYLILNQQLVGRLWATVAGYVIPEDDATHTLDDTLNFIAE